MELAATSDAWLDIVLRDFDQFLKDHASCEKKASGMALAMASHYPDQPALLNAMANLAVEELTHYRQVVRLLTARGSTPGPDRRDPYVRALNASIRTEPPVYLLDRLLIAAIVERRGCERFALVANALANGPEKSFYQAISESEDRHWRLFLTLAESHCHGSVPSRLAELIAVESRIVAGLPLRPALH